MFIPFCMPLLKIHDTPLAPGMKEMPFRESEMDV